MTRFKWKDSPHQKLFWITVVVIMVIAVLVFAKRVAGI